MEENNFKIVGYYIDKSDGSKIPVVKGKYGYYPCFILNENPIYKRYQAFNAISIDLVDCIAGINLLKKIINLDEVQKVIKVSLMFTAIVKYAKCFTEANGRGTRLDKSIYKFNTRLSEIHLNTMKFRNEYLAHAGKSNFESFMLFAVLDPDIKNKGRVGITCTIDREMDNPFPLDDYLILFKEAKNYVTEKLTKDFSVRLNKIVDEIPIDVMYLKSHLPGSNDDIHFYPD